MNDTAKAAIVGGVHGRLANFAPVTRINSPSAMMMNSPQRSAMWLPSMSQSAVVERPSPGVQNPTEGDSVLDEQRHRPQPQPRFRLGKSAGDPEHGGQRQPSADALEIADSWRGCAPSAPTA